MIRKEAIRLISKEIGDKVIVSANGYISRDLFEMDDKPTNFYMIGSMGLTSSIGLGLALQNPKKMIYVFDGDGNILMNLGSITTIGVLKPKNFVHVIFDNSSHESTGGQPTNSEKIRIEKIAKASNYKVFLVTKKNKLKEILKRIKIMSGPIMIVVKVKKSNYVSCRVKLKPKEIRNRFMNNTENKKN